MSLPEISRRCLGCGAAVRAGARFCPQCGKEMGGEAPPPGAARADEKGVAADVAPAAEAPAEGDELRLEESWRRWQESVGEHAPEAQQPGEPTREESRDAVGEIPAPAPQQPTPPQSPPAVAPLPPRDGRGATTGVPFDTVAGRPLARPRPGEKGRRAAAVKESLRPRVEKVRDASMGVLEDAAEDSGLRFVLIAVALFLVFLIFLFINNLVR